MTYDYDALTEEIADHATTFSPDQALDARAYWQGMSREMRIEYASELISRTEDDGEDREIVLDSIARRICADATELPE